jgi:hypothetical protein
MNSKDQKMKELKKSLEKLASDLNKGSTTS